MENFENFINKYNEMLKEAKKDLGEGSVVVINPTVGGGCGIIKEIFSQNYVVTVYPRKKDKSYHKSDVMSVDDAPSKWITKKIEKILDKM